MSRFAQRFENATDMLLHEHGDEIKWHIEGCRPNDNVKIEHALWSGEDVGERETEHGDQLVYKSHVAFCIDPNNPKFSGVTKVSRSHTYSVNDVHYEIYRITDRAASYGWVEVHGRRYAAMMTQRRDHDGGDY